MLQGIILGLADKISSKEGPTVFLVQEANIKKIQTINRIPCFFISISFMSSYSASPVILKTTGEDSALQYTVIVLSKCSGSSALYVTFSNIEFPGRTGSLE